MPIKLGTSLPVSSSLIRVSMEPAAPAESAMTARSWEPSRFVALVRYAILRFRQVRCTSKVSPFVQQFAGCPSTPASISRKLMHRASAVRFRASALPIAILRVATIGLTSCERACVRRAQSDRRPPRRLSRIDQTERPRAGKSASGCETGAWPSMSDLRLANSPAQKSRNVRTRAVLRRSG
jgi:hypothetical protein